MNAAIIVAAGRGHRMGGKTDKLFLELAGLPAVGHTWRRFDQASCIQEIVLVIRQERQQEFAELADRLNLAKPFRFAFGGVERQDSVWNGLQSLSPACELIAIQDGARPVTPQSLISEVLEAARHHGAAVAATPMTDTVKESKDGQTIARHLDRSRLWAVQTPQCFRRDVILQALQSVRDRGLNITDDTAACEMIGQAVRLVCSTRPNPKLTTPEDVAYLQWLLTAS